MKMIVTQVKTEVPEGRYCIDKESGKACKQLTEWYFGVPEPWCDLHKKGLQKQFRFVPLKCDDCRKSVDV